MSKQKTERLLSLVVCLLSARRYLTAGQIRAAVPGYPETFDAFKRMFERDKDELRELGIPLETGTNPGSDEEVGYRISQQAYELPEIRLEPDEAAVLGLAAQGLAAGRTGRRRGRRPAQAARGWHRCRGDHPAGDRAAAADRRRRVRPAVAGGQGRRPVSFGYQAAGRAAPQRTKPGAMGSGEQARPLVRGRASTGTGARSGCSG